MNSLESYLLENIPISSALGVRVSFASKDRVVLAAPYVNNINHKKTVFGGSLHSLTTLACWSMLYLNVPKDYEIVIAQSKIEYLAAVTTDFEAECIFPSPVVWARFNQILSKKKKSRIELSAKVVQEGRLCVHFTGIFAAIYHR